jgi:hypothetical protein
MQGLHGPPPVKSFNTVWTTLAPFEETALDGLAHGRVIIGHAQRADSNANRSELAYEQIALSGLATLVSARDYDESHNVLLEV